MNGGKVVVVIVERNKGGMGSRIEGGGGGEWEQERMGMKMEKEEEEGLEGRRSMIQDNGSLIH